MTARRTPTSPTTQELRDRMSPLLPTTTFSNETSTSVLLSVEGSSSLVTVGPGQSVFSIKQGLLYQVTKAESGDFSVLATFRTDPRKNVSNDPAIRLELSDSVWVLLPA